MKKHIILSAIALASVVSAVASTTHTLRDVPFTVDTLLHYPIAPGANFTQLRYQSQQSVSKHFTANVIDFDMASAAAGGLDFRMHLGKDSIHTSEQMTAVARRHSDNDNQYLAAINGDFFITWASTPGMLGYPNNTACTGGQMAISDNVDHDNHVDAFVMDKAMGMWCDQTVLSPKIIMPDNTTNYKLYGVNYARRDDSRKDAESDAQDIVFYNQYRGNYTGSSAGWRELAVVLADGAEWRINQSVKLKVVSEVSTSGHMAIPRDGGVIAAAADAPIDLESLHPGDIVKLKINLSLPTFGDLKPDVKEVIGGDVTLLRDGQAVMTANRFINSRDGEYPRTMVGYNADRSHMVWCVVDGKTALNTGVSYPQGADMMKALGCVDAINFDGGGSTMMWTKPAGIVNTPSDGQERAVGNGFFAVLRKPADTQVASIRFKDWALTSPQYGLYSPVIYGYNQYGELVDTDVKDFVLSCPDELGVVSEDGQSVLINGIGSHPLTARMGQAEATISVNVIEAAEVSFATPQLLIDNIRQWSIETYSKVGSEMMPLAPQALTWVSDDPSVASVDEMGVVSGHADGVTFISGAVGTFIGAVKVTVQCPTAQTMDIDPSLRADDWKVTGSSTDNLSITTLGDNGLRVNYNITSSRSPKVTVAPINPIRLWSLPDAMRIYVTPTGPEVTSHTVTLTPANGRNVSIKGTSLTGGVENMSHLNLGADIDLNNPASYPITLQSIGFNVSGTGAGQIDISRILTYYSGFTGVPDLPVNGESGSVDPSLPVVYYNLQGIKVTNPSNGIYIRRQGTQTSKIIL